MRAVAALEARVLLSHSPGAGDELVAWEAADAAARAAAARAARALGRLDVRALLPGEADYPAGLRDLRAPPRVWFVRGALPAHRGAVAIVGSRAASPYGIARAEVLAAEGACRDAVADANVPGVRALPIGELRDLSRRGEGGEYPDEVVSTVDADGLGLDISRYFI